MNETQNTAGNSNKNDATKGETVGPMPKHIPFPDFQVNSEVSNEFLGSVFLVSTAIMQFCNIYRTGWWLPDSFVYHSVNVHLIDPYLFAIIFIVTTRRLFYCILLEGLELLQRHKRLKNRELLILRSGLRYAFGIYLAISSSFCVWKIYKQHSYFALFILLYPIIVYILIFGFNIEPFLRLHCEFGGNAYLNGLPMHSCSMNPVTIREEIDVLRHDFNMRFRQIIFTTSVNAYFTGFIPCFFAVSMVYNKVWATQHVLYVWLSGFTMAISSLYPAKYGDLLHRASLHLGYWMPLELIIDYNLYTGVAIQYSKSQLYPNNSIVKHNGEYYRSYGPTCCAIPGNTSHTRFYRLFQNPSMLYKVLTTIQACIILSEVFILYFAFTIEWHFTLSISFIALTNTFTLFKIVRDYFLAKRIYKILQNNSVHGD